LATACVIFQGKADPGVPLIERVARTLGGVGIDDQIRAVRALTRCRVSPAAIQAAIKALEADRVVKCNVCSKSFKARVLDEHLRSEHGYVDYESKVLPLELALAQLWPRVFDHYDVSAAGIVDQLMNGSR